MRIGRNATACFLIALTGGAYAQPISGLRPRVTSLGLTASGDERPYVRLLTLPVVLSMDGADGARWTTELAVANASAYTVRVHFRYVAMVGGGSGEADDTLPALRQRFEPDAISYLARLGLDLRPETAHSGTLTATFRDVADPNLVHLSARVTTPSGTGRAGLSMRASTKGSEGAVWIPGLLEDAKTRSNLSLFNLGNPGDLDLLLHVTAYPGDPLAMPTGPTGFYVQLRPGEFRQIDRVLSAAGIFQGFVRIEPALSPSWSSAPYVARASVIDRATNAGSMRESLYGQPFSAVGLAEAVDSPAWRTEVIATNYGPEAGVARFWWVLPDRKIPFQVALRAREQVVLDDVGALVRATASPLPETMRGPVRLDFSGTATLVLLSGRVLSRGPAGAHGVGVEPPQRLSSLSRIFGLVQDGTSRSSLVLVNASAFPIQLHVETYDGDSGNLVATRTVSLDVDASVAIPSFLASESPGVRQGWVTVEGATADASFNAFSVRNDGASPGEGTGDGQFLVAEPTCRPPAVVTERRRLVSFVGGRVDSGDHTFPCDGYSRTDVPWLNYGGSEPLSAAPNQDTEPREGRFIDHDQEFSVLQHGNAPGPADGTYLGFTGQGFPLALVVEKGDFVHAKLEWRAAPVPSSSCATSGTVDNPIPHGNPVEPGWPFNTGIGTVSLSGTMDPHGELAGTMTVARWCGGRMPVFEDTPFTAQRHDMSTRPVPNK